MSKPHSKALIEAALEAFWTVVVSQNPDTKYGDISPDATHALRQSAVRAISEWKKSNTPCPLLVPTGESLVPGSMYLRLFHGRNDPDQQMEDWGFDGPTFGPLSGFVQTYCSTIRLQAKDDYSELWLETVGDMITFEGSYFGDWEVFVADAGQKA